VNFHYPSGLDTFREEVRAWATVSLGEIRSRPETGHDTVDARWQRCLHESGWATPTWPTEYGGRGVSALEAAVAADEFDALGAPMARATGGELLVGPTILHFGTPEQRQRFLPSIARGEHRWCQGFSEPEAGSDLASLRTTAVLDGDTWIVNGHKTWTSEAEDADYMFLLAVTEPEQPRHRSLSYLLLPMRQEGVSVRPVVQPDGRAGFNEVVLTDARAPRDHVLGDPGQGWQVAMGTLGFERGVSAFAGHHRFDRELAAVVDTARENGRLSDPLLRDRIVQAWQMTQVLRLNYFRMLSALADETAADPGLGALQAVHKMQWTEFHQSLTDLALDVLGAEAQILTGSMDDPPPAGVGMGRRVPHHDYPVSALQATYLFAKAGTIYGGSSEIQRNIVAERVLDLPREPRPAR
jgi:alkylation response protein AidB-like acyl-CoA dehydrogenase